MLSITIYEQLWYFNCFLFGDRPAVPKAVHHSSPVEWQSKGDTRRDSVQTAPHLKIVSGQDTSPQERHESHDYEDPSAKMCMPKASVPGPGAVRRHVVPVQGRNPRAASGSRCRPGHSFIWRVQCQGSHVPAPNCLPSRPELTDRINRPLAACPAAPDMVIIEPEDAQQNG